MKITCTLVYNGLNVAIWYPFDEDLNMRTCVLNASGGVTIRFKDEDEFGNETIQTIELCRDDIELINNTKL